MQEEYHAKRKKLFVCFVDPEKSVGMCNEEERNTRSFVRAVMCLYNGAKIRVRVDSELSEEFEFKRR